VGERERERERKSACVCMRESVCVCVREREKTKRVCVRERVCMSGRAYRDVEVDDVEGRKSHERVVKQQPHPERVPLLIDR
jgi:hypothetical protein